MQQIDMVEKSFCSHVVFIYNESTIAEIAVIVGFPAIGIRSVGVPECMGRFSIVQEGSIGGVDNAARCAVITWTPEFNSTYGIFDNGSVY